MCRDIIHYVITMMLYSAVFHLPQNVYIFVILFVLDLACIQLRRKYEEILRRK